MIFVALAVFAAGLAVVSVMMLIDDDLMYYSCGYVVSSDGIGTFKCGTIQSLTNGTIQSVSSHTYSMITTTSVKPTQSHITHDAIFDELSRYPDANISDVFVFSGVVSDERQHVFAAGPQHTTIMVNDQVICVRNTALPDGGNILPGDKLTVWAVFEGIDGTGCQYGSVPSFESLAVRLDGERYNMAGITPLGFGMSAGTTSIYNIPHDVRISDMTLHADKHTGGMFMFDGVVSDVDCDVGIFDECMAVSMFDGAEYEVYAVASGPHVTDRVKLGDSVTIVGIYDGMSSDGRPSFTTLNVRFLGF